MYVKKDMVAEISYESMIRTVTLQRCNIVKIQSLQACIDITKRANREKPYFRLTFFSILPYFQTNLLHGSRIIVSTQWSLKLYVENMKTSEEIAITTSALKLLTWSENKSQIQLI